MLECVSVFACMLQTEGANTGRKKRENEHGYNAAKRPIFFDISMFICSTVVGSHRNIHPYLHKDEFTATENVIPPPPKKMFGNVCHAHICNFAQLA